MKKNVSELINVIDNSEFTTEECVLIYTALSRQKSVIGGQLLTDRDIERTLKDVFGLSDITIEKDWISDVKDVLLNAKRHMLDDGKVGDALREAAREADITIHISNIEWSVDDKAELEDLYTEKDIPLTELEGYDSVGDYLTEDSGYCVVNFS